MSRRETFLVILLIVLAFLTSVCYVKARTQAISLEEKLKVAVANYETSKFFWEEKIAALSKKILEREAELAALTKSMEAVRLEREKIEAELAAVKKSISEMKNSEIGQSIGQYIGEKEIAELAGGRFSLSRLGAEKTLFLFKERDSFALVIKNQARELELAEKRYSLTRQQAADALQQAEAERVIRLSAEEALRKSLEELSLTKRQLRRGKILSFLEGTGVGIGAGVVLSYLLLK